MPVAEILVKNQAQIDAETKGGYTPLHIASHYGQVNMVRFLLSNGASVKSKTSIGYTPLHQAAQQGHTHIVNILLENAAEPNATTNVSITLDSSLNQRSNLSKFVDDLVHRTGRRR